MRTESHRGSIHDGRCILSECGERIPKISEVTKRCRRGQPGPRKCLMVNVRLYFRTHSGHIGAGFVLDENKLSSREKRARRAGALPRSTCRKPTRPRSERVRAFACVLLESTFRPTQASASLPRALHSKPVGRLRASPRKLRIPLPTPCVPGARAHRSHPRSPRRLRSRVRPSRRCE